MKRALIATAQAAGLWSLSRRITRGTPRIFMLHRFSATAAVGVTEADELVRLIRRVRAECECVTVRELMDRMNNKNDTPRRPLACITVDDGYEDFYKVALPILVDLGVPATLYATAGFVDGQCWLWWDALRYLIDRHPPGLLALNIDGQTVSIHLSDAASRATGWSYVADRLVQSNAARLHVLAQLQSSAGVLLPARPPVEVAPLTWDQLGEIERAGVEIGGHTMTHAFLPGLDAAELLREIGGAKKLIEQHLKTQLVTFAYPNGMPYDCTTPVLDAVRAAGFSAALLAHPRPFRRGDRFRIGRWCVRSEEPMLEHILSGVSALKLRLSAA